MQNDDEASLSISPAGRGQLVKMLITLESQSILLSNFAYLYILKVVWPMVLQNLYKNEQGGSGEGVIVGYCPYPKNRALLKYSIATPQLILEQS